MESRRGVKRKKQLSRGKRIFLLTLLLIMVLLSGGSLFAYNQVSVTYHRYLALATAGTQHLRAAMTLLESLQAQPFASQTLPQARREFQLAQTDIDSLQAGLASFPGASHLVPVYGSRLVAAIHLSALAADVTRAGIAGCDVLGELLLHIHNPLNGKGSQLTGANFSAIGNDFQKVDAALNAAMDEATQIQPGDVTFDAHLAKLLGEFLTNIPRLRQGLSDIHQLLPALPALLGVGSPAHYLVEVLDSTELRPGGGFIGNYGILTIQGGQPSPPQITDVDLLDRPFEFAGHSISYPSNYNWFAHFLSPTSWSLRDSNLDADFPTAARYGEANYQLEGGNIPLQGVIAITPTLIQDVLSVTGPIRIPEYNETITAQNLIERIHYHQLGHAGQGSDNIPSPDGHSSLRKRFTSYLAQHMLATIQQLPQSTQASFAKIFVHAWQTKDVQMYLNSTVAESVLLRNHLAGALEAPQGDSLFVVDANVGGDKANSFITSTVEDRVTIDADGNALHHALLHYAWSGKGSVFGSNVYKDYVRVYVPPHSVLLEQHGWLSSGTNIGFARAVWSGSFTLVYGQSVTISLAWRVPGAARKIGDTWQYNFLGQRQAGKVSTLRLNITLPHGVVLMNTSPDLVSSSPSELALTPVSLLTRDMSLAVNYHP